MSDSHPSVSIVIPTYGHADFVGAALDSVFAQTYRDFEVVVVNDGSTDGTAAAVAPYVRSRGVKYVEQPNQGQAAARNRGLQEARGSLIAFLDDDDRWPPDKLAWQVEFLTQRRDAVGVAGPECIDWDRHDPSKPPVPFEQIDWRRLFDGNPIRSPGQALLRTAAVRGVGGFDPTIRGADDLDLWLKLSQAGELYLGGPVALLYRLHAANASRNHVQMFMNTMHVICKHSRELPLSQRLRLRCRGFRFLSRYKGGDLRDALWEFARHGRLVSWGRLMFQTRLYWAFRVLDPERVRGLGRGRVGSRCRA